MPIFGALLVKFYCLSKKFWKMSIEVRSGRLQFSCMFFGSSIQHLFSDTQKSIICLVLRNIYMWNVFLLVFVYRLSVS